MIIAPWFNGLPEPIQILFFVIFGLTSLCTALAALLHQYNRLRREWTNTAKYSKKEIQK